MRPVALCTPLLTVSTRTFALTTPSTRRLFSSSATKMVDYRELTNQLVAKMKQEDELRNRAYDRSWDLNAALIRVEMLHEESLSSPDAAKVSALEREEEALDKLFQETALSPDMYNNVVHNPTGNDEITTIHERAPRRGNIDYKMESYARYKSVRHYLAGNNNGLLSPNAPCFSGGERNILTDEEYLGGACIGLCHDLSKIAVTRASNAMLDPTAVPFVQDARDTVSNILQELLEFDWRNSPLRRKYDSTKYALKRLETVLYELNVAGALGGQHSLKSEEGGPKKRIKMDCENSEGTEECKDEEMDTSASTVDIFRKEIFEVKERMDHRDKLRENLIKTSRDAQKCAKNAIFSLHRNNTKSAAKLLQDCENCVRNDLLPIVQEEPTLRGGSFSNVLEEYVEGRLFYCWLHGNGEEESSGNDMPAGKILMFDEINLPITVDEYIGGLCDLTGEIGRFAVARGTVRDKKSVSLCLETSKNIMMAIRMAGKLPGNINKKMNPLQKTVEKMETLLYEQSLMEMAGRKFESSMEQGGIDAEE